MYQSIYSTYSYVQHILYISIHINIHIFFICSNTVKLSSAIIFTLLDYPMQILACIVLLSCFYTFSI